MNVVAAPTALGVLVGIAGMILLALLAFKTISAVFHGKSGARRAQESAYHATHSGFFRSGILPSIVVGIMLLVWVRARSGHQDTAHESDELVAHASGDLREAMQDLSDARRDIQDAVRDVSRIIPIDFSTSEVSATNSDSTADVSRETVAVSVGLSPVSAAVTVTRNAAQPPESSEIATTSQESASPAAETVAASAETPAAVEETSAPGSIIAAIAEPPAGAKELQNRKSELAAHIGQWIRSLVEESPQENSAATDGTQAAESANGDVVVLQLSDQMAEQLLGETGHKLLKSFNSDLPERIRQTYALISLTPPVDTAVSSMKPLLANGGLEAIANSLVAVAERVDSVVPDGEQLETDPAVALTSAPEVQKIPDWVADPGGGRIVVETDPLLPGEDSQQPLADAINKALAEHLSVFTETLDPVLRNQARFVKLELDRETARECTVDSFERLDEFESGVAGRTPFFKVYALLEFPESVDNAAVQKIRQSLQNDRMAGLGIIVACVWLSVCSAGCSIRLWRNGSRWLRLTTIPVIGVSLSLILGAMASTIVVYRGDRPRPPWERNEQAVLIHVDSAV